MVNVALLEALFPPVVKDVVLLEVVFVDTMLFPEKEEATELFEIVFERKFESLEEFLSFWEFFGFLEEDLKEARLVEMTEEGLDRTDSNIEDADEVEGEMLLLPLEFEETLVIILEEWLLILNKSPSESSPPFESDLPPLPFFDLKSFRLTCAILDILGFAEEESEAGVV